jgi:hypothetical protein
MATDGPGWLWYEGGGGGIPSKEAPGYIFLRK